MTEKLSKSTLICTTGIINIFCNMNSFILAILIALIITYEACEIRIWQVEKNKPDENLNNKTNDSISYSTKTQLSQLWRNLIPSSKMNNSLHIISGPQTEIQPYGSFLRNASQHTLLLCSSAECDDSCDACLLRNSIDPMKAVEATVAVIQDLKIRQLVILYDDTLTGLRKNISSLLGLTSLKGISFVSIYMDFTSTENKVNFRKQMQSLMLSESSTRHLMVICKEETMEKLIKEARNLTEENGILNQRFFWILLVSVENTTSLLQQLPPYSNVMVLRNRPQFARPQMEVLKEMSEVVVNTTEGCMACDTCRTKILKHLGVHQKEWKEIEILATFTRNQKGDSSEIRMSTVWKKVAAFRKGILIKYEDLYPNTFKDFEGRTLVIGGGYYPPFITPTGRVSFYKGTLCIDQEGVVVDMLNMLAERLKFKPCYVYSVDSSVGDYDAQTGKVTGLIGMIVKKQVTIVILPLTQTKSRKLVVDFSFPFLNDAQTLVIRRERQQRSLFEAMTPFKWNTWLTIIAMIFGMSIFLTILSRIGPLSAEKLMKRKRKNKLMVQIKERIWNLFASVLEQGQFKFPKACSGRTLNVSYWMFSLILINVYTATLIRYLTTEDYTPPIRSLKDLSKQTSIRPLPPRNSFLINMFKNAKDPVNKRIGNLLPENIPKSQERVEMLLNNIGGRWAFMGDQITAWGLERTYCQNLTVIPETFLDSSVVSFGWYKNSYFSDKANALMKKLVESGFVKKTIESWFKIKFGPPCPPVQETNLVTAFSAAPLTTLITPTVIFAVFVLTAVLSFGAEYFLAVCYVIKKQL